MLRDPRPSSATGYLEVTEGEAVTAQRDAQHWSPKPETQDMAGLKVQALLICV